LVRETIEEITDFVPSRAIVAITEKAARQTLWRISDNESSRREKMEKVAQRIEQDRSL
jgi:hypothetical protein